MGWTLVVVVWLAVAVATAVVAGRRGHDRVLWGVLGLVFPGAALLALLLGYPKSLRTPGRLTPDVDAALRQNQTARTLAASPGLDMEAISRANGLPVEQVGRELGALRVLGLVRRDRATDTWTLTPRAVAALSDEPRPGA